MIFSSCCCRFISNPKTAPDSCSTSMLCHRRTVLGRRRENISGHRRRRVVISWCRREAVLSSRTSTCRRRNFPKKTGGEESEFVISDDSQIFIFFKNFRIRFDCAKRQIDCFRVHLFFWRGEGLSLEVSHGGSWRGRWHSCKYGVVVGVCKYKKKDIWDEMQGNCS